jgi:hypothetical protein
MWGDFAFDIGIAVILRVVKDAVHDPKKKAAVKRALVKVADAITTLYAADTEATALPHSGSPVE